MDWRRGLITRYTMQSLSCLERSASKPWQIKQTAHIVVCRPDSNVRTKWYLSPGLRVSLHDVRLEMSPYQNVSKWAQREDTSFFVFVFMRGTGGWKISSVAHIA